MKYLLYFENKEVNVTQNTLHHCFEDLCEELDKQSLFELYILFMDLEDMVMGLSKSYPYENSLTKILITKI